MAARKTHQETIPPTLPSEQGIRYLLRQIRRLEQHIILLPHNHAEVENWITATKEILNQVFGQPHGGLHIKTSDFLYARGGWQNHALPFGGYEDTRSRYLLAQEKERRCCSHTSNNCRIWPLRGSQQVLNSTCFIPKLIWSAATCTGPDILHKLCRKPACE